MNPCAAEPCRPAAPAGTAEPAGLYVHVPFCLGKCAYCDFASVPASPARISRWLRALAAEASLQAGASSRFDTLYLGGGTPSLLHARELETLLGALRRRFRFTPDVEATLEANPDDVTPEKFALWRALGMNRLSLGVQSLEDRHLAFLGRRHDAAQALRALEAAAAGGLASWSADVIFGLPGQTPRALERELSRLLSFGPDHVSCYQLTPAAGTPLARRLESGQASLPGEEEQRALFLAASRRLEAGGYLHYEVSNFCRIQAGGGHLEGREPGGPAGQGGEAAPASAERAPDETPGTACRHNLKYWTRAPYLGLGPSAHSFHGNERWWNPRCLERYCEAVEAGRPATEGRETLTPEQERMEALSLALRTRRGIGRRELASFPGSDRPLARLLRERLLEEAGDRVAPTPLGFLVADRLPLLFL